MRRPVDRHENVNDSSALQWPRRGSLPCSNSVAKGSKIAPVEKCSGLPHKIATEARANICRRFHCLSCMVWTRALRTRLLLWMNSGKAVFRTLPFRGATKASLEVDLYGQLSESPFFARRAVYPTLRSQNLRIRRKVVRCVCQRLLDIQVVMVQ